MKSIIWMKNSVFLIIAMIVTSNVSLAKEFYKWVDSKGSTHYTTTPPPKSSQARGKIDTYGYRTSSTPNVQPTTIVEPTQQNTKSDSNTTQNPTVSNTLTPQNQSIDTQQREANAALENGLINRSAPQ